MTGIPETKYVQAGGGVKLAYQVSGQGSLKVLFIPGAGIPIDLFWDDPGFLRVGRRLDRFAQTVWFEVRGAGASEGIVSESPAPETFDADVIAVLNAVGYERVALVGTTIAGQAALPFAVAHPERLSALVLINIFAHYLRHDDYPCGLPPDVAEDFYATMSAEWGSAAATDAVAPSRTSNERFRLWFARGQRLAASPGEAAARVQGAFERDYRPLLSAIEVPTLVLHRRGDRLIRIEAGRYLAEHIPGAKYVELPGEDHLFFAGDVDAWLDEVEEFLTGRHEPTEGDVVLATVLFTDIVDSTTQQASLGQRNWARLVDAHNALVRDALRRHAGRAIKTLGDGFLITFDGTTRAVRCAQEIVAEAAGLGLGLRAGLHNGEVEVRDDDDVAGLAVTIAKRVCDLAGPGQVLISETVKGHLVGSGIELEDQGSQSLKGVPEEWRLFAVKGWQPRR